MNRAAVVSISLFAFLFLFFTTSDVLGQTDALKRGIEEYRKGNYEEALEILKKAKHIDPRSTAVAFFLGLAYKQTMDFRNAADNFREAVTLAPRIRDALPELIESLYRLPENEGVEEAKKWIAVAEEEKILPAKTAFLKGLVLQKEGKNLEAVAAFETAKSLDPSLAQAVDFQCALCYMRERKLKRAQAYFQTAILFDPQTELADYARRYQDLIEKRIELEKPLRVTFGVLGQYDSNVVLAPLDSALAPDITDESSLGLSTSLRVDYAPILEGPWLFNAHYSLNGNFHEKFSTTHDSLVNGIYLVPGVNLETWTFNWVLNYSHALVRSPSYGRYVEYFSTGPLIRSLVTPNQILEFQIGWDLKNYFQPPLAPEEDRDAKGGRMSLGWIGTLAEGSFLSLRYELSDEDTDGANWDNLGHRFSASLSMPLYGPVRLQAGADAFLQDYRNVHTFFQEKRKDKTYTGSLGISWEFFKNTSFIAQFTKTRANSNIGVYAYDRDIISSGIEYRF